MKKTFRFESAVHAPARVVASIKNDVRKYLKRERRKPIPEGVDFHDFDCRVGKDPETAEVIVVADLIQRIDSASAAGWDSVYIEILAKPGHRLWTARPETVSREESQDTEGE